MVRDDGKEEGDISAMVIELVKVERDGRGGRERKWWQWHSWEDEGVDWMKKKVTVKGFGMNGFF